MTRQPLYAMLAEYNRWINHSIFECAASMSEDDVYSDEGAYFGSVFSTLSHIFTCDLLWLYRFRTLEDSWTSLNELDQFPSPATNSEDVFSTFEELHQARTRLDEVIVSWVDELTDEDFIRTLTYQSTTGDTFTNDFPALLLHFFNHQTHHRGQTTTLINQMGIDVGCTDLVAVARGIHRQHG
ncbi:DinB family protein [Parasalinivibrio latis]|uniref:DinB family protein n=1 Tax=Parasalinivibrio latis TaxID=2952610 RepID=UPI0030E3EC08